MQLISALLLLGTLVFLVFFATWMRRKERERLQFVSLTADRLELRHKGETEMLDVGDICEVRYSWYAAAYFSACWEIQGKSGATLALDWEAVGLNEVLSGLERLLVGFSVAEVKKLVSDGDIHGETICAWQIAA
jgi:hypothetical protein